MSFPAAIDRSAREILAHYPPDIAGAGWTALGNAGGFSGARIWRGLNARGQGFCLRAWPMGKIDDERLRVIHSAMEACRLPTVPRLEPTLRGETWLQAHDQFWEISTWMPGKANFHSEPTNVRLFAAMRTLAEIHQSWKSPEPRLAPCPAVRRITRALLSWRGLVQSGWKPNFQLPFPDEIKSRAKRAWQLLTAAVIGVEFELLDWEQRLLPVQTCFCDVWHDHILYQGDQVMGVIDFGAVKLDCVAIDLARLLGSLIPDEPERMDMALAVYSATNPIADEVVKLVPLLDRVGCVIGLTNWIRWMYYEKRLFPESAQVVRRMDALLQRLERKNRASVASWALLPLPPAID